MMAKASSLAKNLAKELECAVCLEQYKEPKVLPCLHSFCKKCLEGLLTKQGLVWKLNCPSCRASVEVSLLKCCESVNSIKKAYVYPLFPPPQCPLSHLEFLNRGRKPIEI